MRAGHCNNNGYTLIELLVVIAVLATISGLTIPRLDAFSDWADVTSSQFRRAVGDTREKALLDRKTYRLNFSLNQNLITIETVSEGGEIKRDELVEIPDCGTIQHIVVNGIEKKGDEVIVLIRPDGWMDDTTIHLEGCDGRTLNVHLSALAGVVEIEK